jgi:hypothetical protein
MWNDALSDINAMGRRRNVKHAPPPKPTPLRPPSATVKSPSDHAAEVQRDERPAPTARELLEHKS